MLAPGSGSGAKSARIERPRPCGDGARRSTTPTRETMPLNNRNPLSPSDPSRQPHVLSETADRERADHDSLGEPVPSQVAGPRRRGDASEQNGSDPDRDLVRQARSKKRGVHRGSPFHEQRVPPLVGQPAKERLERSPAVGAGGEFPALGAAVLVLPRARGVGRRRREEQRSLARARYQSGGERRAKRGVEHDAARRGSSAPRREPYCE